MVASEKTKNLNYRLLEQREVDQVSTLFVRTFLAREPIAKHLISPDDFLKFASVAVNQCTKEGLSFVCEDSTLPEGENIVGFRLADRFNKNDHGDSSDHGPVGYFMGYLDEKWLEHHPELVSSNHDQHKVLDLFALGVRDGYEGLGIGKRLVELTLENAKKHGYELAYVKATAKATQHIFRNHFGFKEMVHLKYVDFEYKGQRLLECLKDLGGVIVFEREL